MPEGRATGVDHEPPPMWVMRAAINTSELGGAEEFTGQVWLDALNSADDDEAERSARAYHAYRVLFEPEARTRWHSHARGQVLYVMSGRGRVGDESGVARTRRCATHGRITTPARSSSTA